MRRPITTPPPHRRTYDNWTLNLLVIHIVKFGGVINNLVHAQCNKIAEHDLGKGPKTFDGQPVRYSNNGGFADRRGKNPVGEKFRQIPCDLERSTVRRPHVFADKNDRTVVLHVFFKEYVDQFNLPRVNFLQRFPWTARDLLQRLIIIPDIQFRFFQDLFHRDIDRLLGFGLNFSKQRVIFSGKNIDRVFISIPVNLVRITVVISFGMRVQTIRFNQMKNRLLVLPHLSDRRRRGLH